MEDLEAKKLKETLLDYESRLQEIRQMTRKNVDTLEVIQNYTDKSSAGIQKLTEQGMQGIQKVTAESVGGLRRILETGTSNLSRMSAAGEDDMNRITQECLESMKPFLQTSMAQIEAAGARVGESAAAVERIEQTIREHLEHMQGLMKQSDDFTHKENVKVYRNVQAVVVEEVKKQTEELDAKNEELMNMSQTLKRQGRGLKPIMAGTLLLSLANLVLLILQILRVL